MLFTGQILAFFGMTYVSGGVGSILLSTEVPIIFILGIVFVGERLSTMRCLGAALVMISAKILAMSNCDGADTECDLSQ